MSAPTSAASSASSSTTVSVMLAIYEKKTTSIDLYHPFRQYIVVNYSEREAQNLEDDLVSLREMRSSLEKPVNSNPPSLRRDLLQSYFRALSAVESRFPISPDRNHVHSVSFTWYDAFKPSKKASQQNIHFEKAAVLFNLGAVYSQIALSSDRNDAPGLKQACNSFQAAAGAFAYLRDNASTKASVGSGSTLDVSVECAGMLERLMLAQAQECFFEKVIADGKPPGLCSKVARQVAFYYEEAYRALNAPPLSQHFDRTWINHVQMKASQFYAEACYRTGLELHEKEHIAEEIVRLKSGLSALTDSKKHAKGVAAPLLDAVVRLETSMKRNLEQAVKENERVYLMRVPTLESLPPLPAASLVKPVSMSEIFDASKERLFANLIPDSSAKALSRYTEMVDDIIRIQAEKLQDGSEITRVKLKEMDLPESILALEGHFSLPVDLKEDVDDVQGMGGPSGLESELQQLRDLSRVNQELLVETEELLQKEEREDTQFRTQFGTRYNRPQSSSLTKNLKDRLNRFAANLKQAADSDARIERAVRDNSALLAILDIRPIESALPSVARPIMSLDGNEDAIVGSLKQSLGQLESLGTQRAGLEDMLKDMKQKDDILPKLMATTGSCEDLFRKEISKYIRICEEITQNIDVQEQLLLQIQVQNEEFAAVFNLDDYRVSREKCYKQISAAITKFREIKNNINDGLKFYTTLQDALMNVKQQCSDFVTTRNMQFKEMIEGVQRQIAGLSFPPDGDTGYNYLSPASSNPHANIPPQADPRSSPQHPSYSYSSVVPPSPPGNMPPQGDRRSIQTPPYYTHAGSPNPPSIVPHADPRFTPPSVGYIGSAQPPNPSVYVSPQADHRTTTPAGYSHPPISQVNPPGSMPQQIDPRTTPSPPPNPFSQVNPLGSIPQQVDLRTTPIPPNPYHQPIPPQSSMGYPQAYPPHGSSHQPSPYQGPPVGGGPYQSPQQPTGREFAAYSGWNDQYPNHAPSQQSGLSQPRPPYVIPDSYLQQDGYYNRKL